MRPSRSKRHKLLQAATDAATAAFIERGGVVSVHGTEQYNREGFKIETTIQKQLTREKENDCEET